MGHGPGLSLPLQREADSHGLGLADRDLKDSVSGLLLQPDTVLKGWHVDNHRGWHLLLAERLLFFPHPPLGVLPGAPAALLGDRSSREIDQPKLDHSSPPLSCAHEYRRAQA